MTERPGTVIGPYKLLEQIGEGGFGLVFMAEQQEPIRRKVALKVVKPGMDSKQVLARFDAERQALALMDHPNIAKVLDAGQTGSGRPYFIMDLVKGLPITDYCDQNQLAPRERLELFLSVCQAVQHAHQKGIIHRDLKPSNILVTLHDGAPLVKVIDFGIAKALGQQLTDQTLFTNFAQMIGTPLYMSPEQAAFGNVDVDTRSDIYSLGVLLYELLTGTAPFEKERFRKVAYDEICRIIREEEPPKPSTRISTLGQAATTVSTNRKMHPKRLSQLFRGELDWIVMKALEKDRERRYESASAFAADVQRYLHDEPVQACPPSAWYRFRKFARRNRARLALTACLLVVVFGSAGTAVWFAEQKAVRRVETERAVTTALTQAKTLVAEGDKQTDHPEQWQATALLAKATLEKAEERLAAGVGTEELAARVGQVRMVVDGAVADSRVLVEIDRIRLKQAAVKGGKFDRARAAPLYAELLRSYGVEPAVPEAAAARVRDSRLRETLLAALGDWRKFTLDEGERQRVARVYELALPPYSLRERLMEAVKRGDTAELEKLVNQPSFQDLPPATVALAAWELDEAGQWAAAEKLLRPTQERKPGDFWLNHLLADVLSKQGPSRAEEALRYWTAALALRTDSPGVYFNLGSVLYAKGDVDGAIRCYQAALRINPGYAEAHEGLGGASAAKGRSDEAIAEYRAAVAEYSKAIELNPKLPNALNNRGTIYCDHLAQYDQAVADFSKAIELNQKFADAWVNRSVAYRNLGKIDNAIADCSKAIELEPKLALAWAKRGIIYCDNLHQYDNAIDDFSKALKLDPTDARVWHNRGVAYRKLGQWDRALADCSKAIELDPKLATAWNNRGWIYCAHFAQYDKAVTDLSRAIELDPTNEKAWHTRGWIYCDRFHQYDKAIADYSKAIDLDPNDASKWSYRGEAYDKLGQIDKAIADYSKAIEVDPKLGPAWKSRGVIYCDHLHQYDKAIADFSKATELSPNDAKAWCNRGLAYSKRSQTEKAIADCTKAIQLDPKLTNAWYIRGTIYCDHLAQYNKAIADFSNAIELDPKFTEAWHNLGIAYRNLGQPDKSVANFSKAIELTPKYASAWSERGIIYCDHLAQYDKAIVDFSKLIELEPENANAWSNRGIAYLRLDQPDKTLADCSKAIELDPKNIRAWRDRGSAYAKLGQLEKAIADSSKAIELDQKNANAWNNRGIIYCDHLAQYDKAVTDFSRAIELDATNKEAWYNRGVVYGKLGQIDQAIADYSKAIELNPRDAKAKSDRADAYLNLGQWKKAIADCSKAIELNPKLPDAWHTLGVAHYRAGNWKAAIAALSKSVELHQGRDASDQLFLAMAYRQQGNRDEARKTYDQAIEWMEKNKETLERNKSQVEELRRLRSEVEEVLELKKK
jgi:tetratricopeptide (TPR) repeat protein/serine/threonine protein kinase